MGCAVSHTPPWTATRSPVAKKGSRPAAASSEVPAGRDDSRDSTAPAPQPPINSGGVDSGSMNSSGLGTSSLLKTSTRRLCNKRPNGEVEYDTQRVNAKPSSAGLSQEKPSRSRAPSAHLNLPPLSTSLPGAQRVDERPLSASAASNLRHPLHRPRSGLATPVAVIINHPTAQHLSGQPLTQPTSLPKPYSALQEAPFLQQPSGLRQLALPTQPPKSVPAVRRPEKEEKCDKSTRSHENDESHSSLLADDDFVNEEAARARLKAQRRGSAAPATSANRDGVHPLRELMKLDRVAAALAVHTTSLMADLFNQSSTSANSADAFDSSFRNRDSSQVSPSDAEGSYAVNEDSATAKRSSYSHSDVNVGSFAEVKEFSVEAENSYVRNEMCADPSLLTEGGHGDGTEGRKGEEAIGLLLSAEAPSSPERERSTSLAGVSWTSLMAVARNMEKGRSDVPASDGAETTANTGTSWAGDSVENGPATSRHRYVKAQIAAADSFFRMTRESPVPQLVASSAEKAKENDGAKNIATDDQSAPTPRKNEVPNTKVSESSVRLFSPISSIDSLYDALQATFGSINVRASPVGGDEIKQTQQRSSAAGSLAKGSLEAHPRGPVEQQAECATSAKETKATRSRESKPRTPVAGRCCSASIGRSVHRQAIRGVSDEADASESQPCKQAPKQRQPPGKDSFSRPATASARKSLSSARRTSRPPAEQDGGGTCSVPSRQMKEDLRGESGSEEKPPRPLRYKRSQRTDELGSDEAEVSRPADMAEPPRPQRGARIPRAHEKKVKDVGGGYGSFQFDLSKYHKSQLQAQGTETPIPVIRTPVDAYGYEANQFILSELTGEVNRLKLKEEGATVPGALSESGGYGSGQFDLAELRKVFSAEAPVKPSTAVDPLQISTQGATKPTAQVEKATLPPGAATSSGSVPAKGVNPGSELVRSQVGTADPASTAVLKGERQRAPRLNRSTSLRSNASSEDNPLEDSIDEYAAALHRANNEHSGDDSNSRRSRLLRFSQKRYSRQSRTAPGDSGSHQTSRRETEHLSTSSRPTKVKSRDNTSVALRAQRRMTERKDSMEDF